MDDRTRELITAPPLPLLAKMATPNSVAFFIQACVSMTEVWFIGQLGTVSLAAIALAFPLLMLTQMMSGGAMGGAVAAAIARSLGAGDIERAEMLIWHTLALAALGALSFLTLFLLSGKWFLALLGGTGEVLEASAAYCLVLFSGGISLWLMGSVSAIYRGMGDMQFPALLMIVSAAIQIPLSGILVLGAFGAPSLGVVGAAVSAVVSATVIAAIMLVRLMFGQTTIKLRWSRFGFRKDLFDAILNVFKPAALSPLFSVATILSLTAIVSRFGEQALAGYGIGSRIEFLMVPLVFGLGASMTSLVGMSVGANNLDRALQVARTGGLSAFVLAGGIGTLLALLPGLWIPLFTENPEVIAVATRYIQIVGPAYGFFGLGLSLYFASQGASAMAWPVVVTFARFVIAVGGAILLGFILNFELTGIFIATALGMVMYGGGISLAIKLGAWHK